MKIGVTGYTGRVGQLLVQELQSGKWPEVILSGCTSRSGSENVHNLYITEDAGELFEHSDAIIDFTLPEATLTHAKLAAQHKKILVVGTTGLSKDQEQELQKAAEQTVIIYAANMSLGVNLLMALVEQAARALDPEWDIEIFESHHKHKIDAPSGTALALGNSAAEGRKKILPSPIPFDRNGARKKGDIGFSVARGGDVVGEHTVFFYGEGERLELTHRATNRALFARGAIKAALWAKGKKPGLYSMKDVLGL